VERVNGPLSWPSSSLEERVTGSLLPIWRQFRKGIISLAHGKVAKNHGGHHGSSELKGSLMLPSLWWRRQRRRDRMKKGNCRKGNETL
jgi:hypothetical protein